VFLRYSLDELRTALQPSLFMHVFLREGLEALCCFDPREPATLDCGVLLDRLDDVSTVSMDLDTASGRGHGRSRCATVECSEKLSGDGSRRPGPDVRVVPRRVHD
jgi:hypothetical protein